MDVVRRAWGTFLRDLSVSLASACLLAVAGLLWSAYAAPAARGAVPAWLAAAATVTAAGLGFAVAYRRRARPRQVFILVSAFVQKRYVAELLENLIHSLDRRGLDLVVKVPDHDYSGVGQLRQLQSIGRRPQAFAGGIIMIAEPATVRDDLEKFCRTARLPIVFIDTPPFHRSAEYPPRTAFVGCDQAEIGAHAATWLAERTGRGAGRPRALVVGSTEHPGRQEGFAAALRRQLPGAVVTVNDRGGYARGNAREIVDRYLTDQRARGWPVDAIFCTNDEMAFGALDALAQHAAAGSRWDDLMVVGVDGIDEARATIQAGGTAFRATVVQDSRRIAELTVTSLVKQLAGEPVPAETIVPTTLYPMA